MGDQLKSKTGLAPRLLSKALFYHKHYGLNQKLGFGRRLRPSYSTIFIWILQQCLGQEN